MNISKKIREEMTKLCGSICEDDGRDPREFHETKIERKESDQYRHERLCQQVAHTLALVLPESVEEPIRHLQINSVVCGQNTSVLKVKLALPNCNHEQQTALLESLKSQEGWLRSEVAAAITRKRVPRLAFEFTVSDLSEGDVA